MEKCSDETHHLGEHHHLDSNEYIHSLNSCLACSLEAPVFSRDASGGEVLDAISEFINGYRNGVSNRSLEKSLLNIPLHWRDIVDGGGSGANKQISVRTYCTSDEVSIRDDDDYVFLVDGDGDIDGYSNHNLYLARERIEDYGVSLCLAVKVG